MGPTIALLTDFGQLDPFVGVMKGVILSRCPRARIVDVSHDIPPQDIRLGAFYLMVSAAYFPKGALFACVVDPGVGSKRRILWARSKTYQFLAPDNGLLSWIREKQPFQEIREVVNKRLFAGEVSRTFHGRDIFAPVAAALARGTSPSALGPKVSAIRGLPFPRPRFSNGSVRGSILAVDRFGNAVTNLAEGDLKAGATFLFKGKRLGEVRSHYSAAEPGGPLALVGSFGFVELAVRNGSFACKFNAKVGDPVYVHF